MSNRPKDYLWMKFLHTFFGKSNWLFFLQQEKNDFLRDLMIRNLYLSQLNKQDFILQFLFYQFLVIFDINIFLNFYLKIKTFLIKSYQQQLSSNRNELLSKQVFIIFHLFWSIIHLFELLKKVDQKSLQNFYLKMFLILK